MNWIKIRLRSKGQKSQSRQARSQQNQICQKKHFKNFDSHALKCHGHRHLSGECLSVEGLPENRQCSSSYKNSAVAEMAAQCCTHGFSLWSERYLSIKQRLRHLWEYHLKSYTARKETLWTTFLFIEYWPNFKHRDITGPKVPNSVK